MFKLNLLKSFGFFAVASMAVPFCSAQEATKVLTLDDALKLAKSRNGTVLAATIDVLAARQRVTQAYAGFLPVVTPFYQYNSNRLGFFSGGGYTTSNVNGGTAGVNSNWRVLDSGERNFQFQGAKRATESFEFNSRQILRSTLFAVIQQYYETLRAVELQKVSEEQVDRAALVLRQTEARIEAGDVAKKDKLQAQADFLNAKVQVLASKNRTTNTTATLKSTIGIDAEDQLGTLQKPTSAVDQTSQLGLSTLLRSAMQARPDLSSRRSSIQSLWMTRRLNERRAGFTFSVDLTFDKVFSPTRSESRFLSFLISYPLFDGGRLRSVAKEAALNIQASQQDLLQAERVAKAEIESAYRELLQNAERLDAAKGALEAAEINYAAAVESQRLGAASVVEVSLARVSLVTAQSEAIQATYDYAISNSRLQLVTGRPMPGE